MQQISITVEAEGKRNTIQVTDPIGSIADPSLREFVQLVRERASLKQGKAKPN